MGADKMAQRVKGFATNFDNLSYSLEFHMVEEESQLLQTYLLLSTHMAWSTHN